MTIVNYFLIICYLILNFYSQVPITRYLSLFLYLQYYLNPILSILLTFDFHFLFLDNHEFVFPTFLDQP